MLCAIHLSCMLYSQLRLLYIHKLIDIITILNSIKFRETISVYTTLSLLIHKCIIKIMERQNTLVFHYLHFNEKLLSFSRFYPSLGILIYIGIFLMLKNILFIFGCCVKKWFGIQFSKILQLRVHIK